MSTMYRSIQTAVNDPALSSSGKTFPPQPKLCPSTDGGSVKGVTESDRIDVQNLFMQSHSKGAGPPPECTGERRNVHLASDVSMVIDPMARVDLGASRSRCSSLGSLDGSAEPKRSSSHVDATRTKHAVPGVVRAPPNSSDIAAALFCSRVEGVSAFNYPRSTVSDSPVKLNSQAWSSPPPHNSAAFGCSWMNSGDESHAQLLQATNLRSQYGLKAEARAPSYAWASTADYSIEAILSQQRSRANRLAFELHTQEVSLLHLHNIAEQLARDVERLQASKAARRLRGGDKAEDVAKLRHENGCLFAEMTLMKRKLESIAAARNGPGPYYSSYLQGSKLTSLETLRGGYASSSPAGDTTARVQQAETDACTWPTTSATTQQRAALHFDVAINPGSLPTTGGPARGVPLQDEGSSWNCEACTFLNHPTLSLCEICDTPRMTGRPSAKTLCCHQMGCYCHAGVSSTGHL